MFVFFYFPVLGASVEYYNGLSEAASSTVENRESNSNLSNPSKQSYAEAPAKGHSSLRVSSLSDEIEAQERGPSQSHIVSAHSHLFAMADTEGDQISDTETVETDQTVEDDVQPSDLDDGDEDGNASVNADVNEDSETEDEGRADDSEKEKDDTEGKEAEKSDVISQGIDNQHFDKITKFFKLKISGSQCQGLTIFGSY